MSISDRLAAVLERIGTAATRAGRDPSEVSLVAVSKTVEEARLREAIASGARIFGENRVQEADAKIAALRPESEAMGVSWHLIGHLQSNKARRAVEIFDLIESVDSLALGVRLDRLASETGRRLPIMIEVNLGGEETKAGVAPDEVLSLLDSLARLPAVELRGLMAVPPYFERAEEGRPFFSRLRELRDAAQRTGIVPEQFRELSMGMSHDFEIAIEEGATCVRIGTAIFGPRP